MEILLKYLNLPARFSIKIMFSPNVLLDPNRPMSTRRTRLLGSARWWWCDDPTAGVSELRVATMNCSFNATWPIGQQVTKNVENTDNKLYHCIIKRLVCHVARVLDKFEQILNERIIIYSCELLSFHWALERVKGPHEVVGGRTSVPCKLHRVIWPPMFAVSPL